MGMSADGFATIINLLYRLEVLALVQGCLAIVELNIVNVWPKDDDLVYGAQDEEKLDATLENGKKDWTTHLSS